MCLRNWNIYRIRYAFNLFNWLAELVRHSRVLRHLCAGQRSNCKLLNSPIMLTSYLESAQFVIKTSDLGSHF